MKSRVRYFILSGTIMSLGCVGAQRVKPFDSLRDSPPATASGGADGLRGTAIGFVPAASAGGQDHRTGTGNSRSRIEIGTTADGGAPHGVIGGAIGALAGGALGYSWMLFYCDRAGGCSGVRPALTGAAIGAILGVGVEWLIRARNGAGHRP